MVGLAVVMIEAEALGLMGEDFVGPPWGAVIDRGLLWGWGLEPLGNVTPCPGLEVGPP